jgi:hypothetical protein
MHCTWGKIPTGLPILRVCPKTNHDNSKIFNMVNTAIKKLLCVYTNQKVAGSILDVVVEFS